jgi:hypothetical protein
MKAGKLTKTEEEFASSLKALFTRYGIELTRYHYFSTGNTTWRIKGEDISVELAEILRPLENKKVEM